MRRSLDKNKIMKWPPKVLAPESGDVEHSGFDQPYLMPHPRKRGLWKTGADRDMGFRRPMFDASAHHNHEVVQTVIGEY